MIRSAVLAAALVLPGAAFAATFSGGWSVSASSSEPGLAVQVSSNSGSIATPDLAVGRSHTFNLFRIWTNEPTVDRDDERAQPISVSFSFTNPVVGGTAAGQTVGERFSFLGLAQQGRLTWNGPVTLAFGDNGTGRMTLTLSDEVFNTAFGGLDEGASGGAMVQATLRYDQAPTASPAAVPLPATLPLLAAGLGALGLAARRRKGA